MGRYYGIVLYYGSVQKGGKIGVQACRDWGHTGDGADELFGGYSFMWAHGAYEVWREKGFRVCQVDLYDLSKLAIESTEQSDCIDVRPIGLIEGST